MIHFLDSSESPIQLQDLEYGNETILMILELDRSERSLMSQIYLRRWIMDMIRLVEKRAKSEVFKIKHTHLDTATIVPLSSRVLSIQMEDKQTTSMLVDILSEWIILIR